MSIDKSGLFSLSLLVLSKSDDPLKCKFEIPLPGNGVEYISINHGGLVQNKCPHIKKKSKNGKVITSISKMLTFIGYDIYGFYSSQDSIDKQIKNNMIEDFKNEIFDPSNVPDMFWIMDKDTFKVLFK
jgi:hypothetical protein